MRFWSSLISAGLVAFALSGPAMAGPTLDWDPLFVYMPAAANAHVQPAGLELKGVGIVSKFDVPLDSLNQYISPPGPNEYTIFIHGLSSAGTDSIGSPGSKLYTTDYTGGSIEIYEDSTPDASFDPNPENTGVPGDFIDGGPPILTGSFTRFVVQTNDFTVHKTGNMEGDILWTGGTLFVKTVSKSGAPCPGLFTGGITWEPLPNVLVPGYLFRHDGKIDFNCPVPTQPSTWGRIKSSYR